MLQARLTYELAMANRDATSLDDARDFDDRMSDDSSGEPPTQHCHASTSRSLSCQYISLLPEMQTSLVCCQELLTKPAQSLMCRSDPGNHSELHDSGLPSELLT